MCSFWRCNAQGCNVCCRRDIHWPISSMDQLLIGLTNKWKLVEAYARRLPIDWWLKIFITAPTAVVSPSYRTQTHYNLQIWMMYWPSVGDASFVCYDGTNFGCGRDAFFNWFLLVMVITKQKKPKKATKSQKKPQEARGSQKMPEEAKKAQKSQKKPKLKK